VRPSLRRAALVAAALALAAAPAPAALGAQQPGALELQLPARAALRAEGPLVRGVGVLSDGQQRDLLRNGFPARLHYRVELWSVGGLLNDLESAAEWNVVVRHDPLDNTYRVARFAGDRVVQLGRYPEFRDAQGAAERMFRAPIVPRRRGRSYYYAVVLDVETLSLTDLDEVERWLKGELRPAVRGRRNPGTALTRGVRTLVVRLLGGEARRYELRSPTFAPE
jgi:hypothetical protein